MFTKIANYKMFVQHALVIASLRWLDLIMYSQAIKLIFNLANQNVMSIVFI